MTEAGVEGGGARTGAEVEGVCKRPLTALKTANPPAKAPARADTPATRIINKTYRRRFQENMVSNFPGIWFMGFYRDSVS
jgi:hypothetical protein